MKWLCPRGPSAFFKESYDVLGCAEFAPIRCFALWHVLGSAKDAKAQEAMGKFVVKSPHTQVPGGHIPVVGGAVGNSGQGHECQFELCAVG